MWRPLSQRIRESAPIRLIADNRFVRKITDKPVTKAPTRRQTVLIGLIPALTAAALLVTGWFIVAFYPDSVGSLPGLLSIVILFIGGLFVGRRMRSVLCTIIATGLYFVFIKASILVVSDYVLEVRGQQVTAVVADKVSNPTGCAAVSAFYSSINRGSSSATTVRRLDGTPLPGAIGLGDNTYRSRHTYKKGEHVEVLIDNAVCMRAKSDVHLVVDTIVAVLAIGCIGSVFTFAALDWRIWRREKYEKWRDQAR